MSNARTLISAIATALLLSSCGDLAPRAFASPTASLSPVFPTASPSPVPTKPVASTALIPSPTNVSWGIDKSESSDRPYYFELYFDGGASGFDLLDGAGQTIARIPIAGSGVFDASSCLAKHTAKSAGRNATWILVDESTYRLILANAQSYRVEAETIDGARVVMLPLADSGCRP
jgi:hypothetical protein